MIKKKTDTIVIRVAPEEKDNIKQAAGNLGLNVSSYLIYLYNKYGKNE